MSAPGRVRVASLAVVIGLAIGLAACTSPEATRTRAGGPGGDTGNRAPVVQMHEGSEPYWRTPTLLAEDLRAPTVASRGEGGPEAPAALPR